MAFSVIRVMEFCISFDPCREVNFVFGDGVIYKIFHHRWWNLNWSAIGQCYTIAWVWLCIWSSWNCCDKSSATSCVGRNFDGGTYWVGCMDCCVTARRVKAGEHASVVVQVKIFFCRVIFIYVVDIWSVSVFVMGLYISIPLALSLHPTAIPCIVCDWTFVRVVLPSYFLEKNIVENRRNNCLISGFSP